MFRERYSFNFSDTLFQPQATSPFTQEKNQWSNARGGNFLTRLETEGFEEGDKASIQFFFDRASRDEQLARAGVNTWDIDTQYEYHGVERNTIIFGGGVRTISDSVGVRELVVLMPDERTYSLVNGFIQDEIEIIPNELTLTSGIKFEHNEFTGPVWQPSIRANWRASPELALWGAISRASRIPSRVSNDIRLPIGVVPPSEQVPLPTLLQVNGSRSGKPETVTSYEAGVRRELTESVRIDSTAFFSDYSRLETYDAQVPQLSEFQGIPVVLQTFDIAASGKAYSFGVENLLEVTPAANARIQFWNSYQVLNTRIINGQTEAFLRGEEHRIPTTQLGARGQFDLPWSLELNPMLRFVDSLSSIDVGSYYEADLQLAWKATDNLRLALNYTNAIRGQHQEYRTDYVTRPASKLESSVFLNLMYKF